MNAPVWIPAINRKKEHPSIELFFGAPNILRKLVLIKAEHYRNTYVTHCILRKENLLMGGYPRFLAEKAKEQGMCS